jgi:hypothetical protein
MSCAHEDEQQRLLAVGYQRAELTMEQLWLRYFALERVSFGLGEFLVASEYGGEGEEGAE